MKKCTANLFSIPLIFHFYLAYAAGPPVSHINSATIEVTQGSEIYANGRMQAVIQVQVELKDGVTWDNNFDLYEYDTKIPIKNLGWIDSDTDNGFDHNITSSRSTIEVYTDSGKKFATKYISTTNSNSRITMCFEIKTQKNGTESTYSTCDKYGIERGTAEILAKRPYTYYASDFEFTQKQVAFKLTSNYLKSESTTEYQTDIKGEIYGIRPAANIARNVFFKLVNTENLITITNQDEDSQKIIANSSMSAIRKYTFKDASISEKNYLGYQESYLYNITGNSPTTGQRSALFQFINYNKAEGATKEYQVEKMPFYQVGDENIVNILDVSYYRDTFMINKERCWNDTASKLYSCRRYNNSDPSSKNTYPMFYPLSTALNDQLYYQVKLQDNFGNEYSLLWQPYPISGASY